MSIRHILELIFLGIFIAGTLSTWPLDLPKKKRNAPGSPGLKDRKPEEDVQ